MTKDRKRFRGISRAVLTATSLASGAALAQSSEPANTPESQSGADRTVEEIVVTGTSIKGAAPVGSNLVSVGVVDLEKAQAINLSALRSEERRVGKECRCRWSAYQ